VEGKEGEVRTGRDRVGVRDGGEIEGGGVEWEWSGWRLEVISDGEEGGEISRMKEGSRG
jgi:hypothetical protein